MGGNRSEKAGGGYLSTSSAADKRRKVEAGVGGVGGAGVLRTVRCAEDLQGFYLRQTAASHPGGSDFSMLTSRQSTHQSDMKKRLLADQAKLIRQLHPKS